MEGPGTRWQGLSSGDPRDRRRTGGGSVGRREWGEGNEKLEMRTALREGMMGRKQKPGQGMEREQEDKD